MCELCLALESIRPMIDGSVRLPAAKRSAERYMECFAKESRHGSSACLSALVRNPPCTHTMIAPFLRKLKPCARLLHGGIRLPPFFNTRRGQHFFLHILRPSVCAPKQIQRHAMPLPLPKPFPATKTFPTTSDEILRSSLLTRNVSTAHICALFCFCINYPHLRGLVQPYESTQAFIWKQPSM